MINDQRHQSTGFNQLDDLYVEHLKEATAAGYHPKIAAVIAYRATTDTLRNRIYDNDETCTHISSGFENHDDENFLTYFEQGEEGIISIPILHFPNPPNDPFHWQTKTLLEYLTTTYKAMSKPKTTTRHPTLHTKEATPSSPHDLTATTEGDTVTLQWNPPTTHGTGGKIIGYSIWRFFKAWTKLVSNTLSTTTTIRDQPFPNKYWYVVRAINNAGPGEWSNTCMANTSQP